jgi:hypothetical protein
MTPNLSPDGDERRVVFATLVAPIMQRARGAAQRPQGRLRKLSNIDFSSRFCGGSMRLTSGLAALAVASLAFGSTLTQGSHSAPPSSYFQEAKITVNSRAKADGYMRVVVTPQGGEAFEATIATEQRMRENEIAKTLATALQASATPAYEIDKDAGEHVKIKKAQKSSADFSVEVTFSSPGFSIILDK